MCKGHCFYSHLCVRMRLKTTVTLGGGVEDPEVKQVIVTEKRRRRRRRRRRGRRGMSMQKVKPWDGCREEGKVDAEGERVGMSTATSSLGCRQHTGHIVQPVLSLPPSPPCLLPLPLPARSQYSSIYSQPNPHSHLNRTYKTGQADWVIISM